VRVKELPALDDEFAKEVSEFDTLEQYKSDVKSKLTEQETKRAEREYEDNLIEKIVEGSTVEIPDAMIKQEADANSLRMNTSRRRRKPLKLVL